MFRRPTFLNLTSLAAWTAGNLAANRAYYEHPLTQGQLGGRKLEALPAGYIKWTSQFIRIQEQYNTLRAALPPYTLDRGYITMTPYISLVAYCHWFLTKKQSIMKEINNTCGVYARQMNQSVEQAAIDLDKAKEMAMGIIHDVGGFIKNHGESEKYYEEVNRIIADHDVDDITGKLIFNGKGLQIINNKKTS